jgi:hypothetical protein
VAIPASALTSDLTNDLMSEPAGALTNHLANQPASDLNGHADLLVQLARLEERLAASERREADLQALVADLRAERDTQAAAHARDREALQGQLAQAHVELAHARKGWLERLLEAVRRK